MHSDIKPFIFMLYLFETFFSRNTYSGTYVWSYNFQVNLTLWGKTAEDFDAGAQPVVALKGVKLSDFGGRSLSAVSSTVIQVNS